MAPEKPTLYLLDNFHPEVIKYCEENFTAILPGTPEHANWRQDARFLLVRSSRLTAEDIQSCPKLIAIGKQGVGIEKIDAVACSKQGIEIFNTPGVNARAVAEMVLSLTMAVAREVGRINTRQTQGVLVPKETCSGLILSQKTVGIIGMGNIGKIVAQIFRGAFDAEVVAYDPFLPLDAWSDISHTRLSSIPDLLKVSDVVTIHVPLTENTRNMISLSEFQIMKRNAILINAARGGIVNESDLEIALRERLIFGAGLDCHEEEPPSKERYEKLWELGVVSTPHVGAATEQTQIETGTTAARRVLEFYQTQAQS
ncbi:D-isomer specific 2-hydroxyacid dehydrogenase [Hypoxylon trugodes]|uniref:D-isomer specific 2-hydroxyacid dehydrogenase n=1 Tax=Hypoxylon trugodes TaxID=326681 RepID=UPI00218EF3A8|nr:D-isomer specific 2-hydroxyacid dehydrogenase [Hypoxylon trugodes]KAI1393112.1 D-isomer specific 2-hydroxyacid dehydrogenase [Hypoxylon trugodes]